MRKLQRFVGVVVVLIMLLGSIGTVATAEQGTQTGTSTQGGGQAGPNRAEPTPEPPVSEPEPEAPVAEPEPEAPVAEQAPATNDSNVTSSAVTTRTGTRVSTRTGAQGPNRPAPRPQQPPQPPQRPPSGGGATGEFWILVDLSDFRMTAFRGNTPVLSSIVNHGRPGYNTPVGTFYVNSKIKYEDMTTFGNLPDVPWTMYFTNRGHALHGTYWTSVNGRLVSHGCVNLPTPVAKQLFDMTHIGARVVIRY